MLVSFWPFPEARSRAGAEALPTTQDDIYCSGIITNESVPHDTYRDHRRGVQLSRSPSSEGDYVYINKGASQGVKVGDEFSVIRAITDPTDIEWTKWQLSILKKMGTVWEDEGRLRVVMAQPGTSPSLRS